MEMLRAFALQRPPSTPPHPTRPAGAYCVGLATPQREQLRAALHERLGEPAGPFTLHAVARCTIATVPTVTRGELPPPSAAPSIL